MSKKPDTAAALAGILKAKREPDRPAETVASVPLRAEPEPPPPPSPAPLPPTSSVAMIAPKKARNGKSSDPNYTQCSIYLRKVLRKKAGRALDDADTGQDFSELVEELLEKWLASRT
jgi:hypothetical protein